MNTLRDWLIHDSLPLWAYFGVDHYNGGFYEKLTRNLLPSNEPRRARLVARQIYFFATATSLGWQGPFENLLSNGYNYLTSNLVSIEGRVQASCSARGLVLDGRQHLYDVAFVLIALAKLSVYPESFPRAEDLARSIAIRLSKEYSNPNGGYFDEISPDMQCSNPHMHLFEAFLEWAELKKPDYMFWLQRANHCAELAFNKMILPKSGVLPEYFDLNWIPMPINGTLVIEPGHQFEWSWLLSRWSKLVCSPEGSFASTKLCDMAEKFGIDQRRNVVFESIDESFKPLDKTARLWQQTERLKAWHSQSSLTGSAIAELNLTRATTALKHFISGPRPGLWFDTMDPNGQFVEEDVKASSGYHLACAIEAISRPYL